MGILVSIFRYLNGEDDDQSPPNVPSRPYNDNVTLSNYNSINCYSNAGSNDEVYSRQLQYLTLSVPNLGNKHPSHGAQKLLHVNDHTCSSVFVNKIKRPGIVEESERKNDMFKVVVAPPVPEGRWIKHYSNCQHILLVGEGDFSFSTCLAKAFGWASNMIATSLDTRDFLVKNYHNALSNIVELSIRNCKVMHEIDATTIASHTYLGCIKFDRIIFNFPFAGFFKDLPRTAQLRLHRRLVSMFLKNAKEMISEDGEIHVSHKTNGFLGEWKLEGMASSHRLRLIEAVDFNQLDYPGYNTKYGFGGDKNFYCYPSKTYKFGLKW